LMPAAARSTPKSCKSVSAVDLNPREAMGITQDASDGGRSGFCRPRAPGQRREEAKRLLVPSWTRARDFRCNRKRASRSRGRGRRGLYK
jgi:hypothetical protein